MTTVFVDDDADLSVVQDRNVAVLGYDDAARAHALCLRDSGVDVRVGVERGSDRAEDAAGDGLRVVSPYEACEEADLVVLLTDADTDADTGAPAGQGSVVTPNLVEGDVVVLGPQVGLGGDSAQAVPRGVDVVRVVAWADGATMRDEFSRGRGVPMFAAVVRDASGTAWDVALSYARAVGATRAGVVRTTDEEYETARRLTQTMLEGDVLSLVRSGFDRLVASGCQPEIAYLLSFQGLRTFAEGLGAGAFDARVAALRVREGDAAASDPYPAAASRVRSMIGWLGSADAGLH